METLFKLIALAGYLTLFAGLSGCASLPQPQPFRLSELSGPDRTELVRNEAFKCRMAYGTEPWYRDETEGLVQQLCLEGRSKAHIEQRARFVLLRDRQQMSDNPAELLQELVDLEAEELSK